MRKTNFAKNAVRSFLYFLVGRSSSFKKGAKGNVVRPVAPLLLVDSSKPQFLGNGPPLRIIFEGVTDSSRRAGDVFWDSIKKSICHCDAHFSLRLNFLSSFCNSLSKSLKEGILTLTFVMSLML